jgi:hypothetical protein
MDYRTREIIHTFKGVAGQDRLCGSVICLKRKFDFSAREMKKNVNAHQGFYPRWGSPHVIICVGGKTTNSVSW